MGDEDGFQILYSINLKGNSASVKFPVPKELEIIARSDEHVSLSIEYYLLARYAYIHNMHSSFMLNTFWTVEYLILSVLVFKYPTKGELSKALEFHAVTKYWEEAKRIVSSDRADCMKKFDNYIGKVMGYFNERYPQSPELPKLTHTGSMPKMRGGDNTKITTGRVYQLNLKEIDHFFNFMLHDILPLSEDVSIFLTSVLSAHKNTNLYSEGNDYSIIYPNKQYSGELRKGSTES